jgi:hypothetical protein
MLRKKDCCTYSLLNVVMFDSQKKPYNTDTKRNEIDEEKRSWPLSRVS